MNAITIWAFPRFRAIAKLPLQRVMNFSWTTAARSLPCGMMVSMIHDQSRQDATTPDSEYTLTIDDALARYPDFTNWGYTARRTR